MCLKLSVNYGQTVKVFVFFHKTEWVYMILRNLNLVGQQNCMICSKITKNSTVFSINSTTSSIGMWGVYPEAIDWNIALHTQISFWASISEVGSQKHFKKWGQFCRFLGSESVFSLDTLTLN